MGDVNKTFISRLPKWRAHLPCDQVSFPLPGHVSLYNGLELAKKFFSAAKCAAKTINRHTRALCG